MIVNVILCMRQHIRVNDYTPFSTSLLSLFLSLSLFFFFTLWMMVFFLKIINEVETGKKRKEKKKKKKRKKKRKEKRENKRKKTKAGPCLGNFKMVCHTIENDMSSIKFIIFMLICFWCINYMSYNKFLSNT